MKLKILNPLDYPNWDDLLTHEDYSFFYTSASARVLSESYGYKPLCFAAIQNGKLSALIPIILNSAVDLYSVAEKLYKPRP